MTEKNDLYKHSIKNYQKKRWKGFYYRFFKVYDDRKDDVYHKYSEEHAFPERSQIQLTSLVKLEMLAGPTACKANKKKCSENCKLYIKKKKFGPHRSTIEYISNMKVLIKVNLLVAMKMKIQVTA